MIRRVVHLASWLVPTLLCVACVPVLTIVLVRWLFGVPISAFRPVLSDEVTYWHQALTFARTGFDGGYYTLGEVTNPSGFTPFGPHGPGFVVLYGLVGSAFDWHRHSVLLLNLVVIAAAAWIWTWCARLTTARLWLSALFLATFWQMLFWAPTGMQEPFHHAGAIVMAALFANALASPPRAWLAVTGVVALCVLSFARPTWIIVMPLWAFVTTRHSKGTRIAATVAGSLLLAALVLGAYSRSVAPFSRGFFFLKALSLSVGLQPIIDNLTFNIDRTVTVAEYDDLEILHRVQYWSFLVAALVLAVWTRRRTSDPPSPAGFGEARWRSGPTTHLGIAAVAMCSSLILMLLLYTLTNWAEHRVLSAFLLFGALLALAAPGRAPVVLVAALILSNVATAGTFRRVFEAKRQEQFIWDRRGVYELQEALAGRVVYRKDQPRWCNTLLTAQEPPHLIAVPAGVGISVVREPDQMAVPPRSRYLLLDQSALTHFQEPLRVEPIATLPYGTLYVNLDSGCD